MKRKVCVRSMFLGAVIMLIGLAVGAIVSPPLIAQRDGVFEKIVCHELEVVNKSGTRAVSLRSGDDGKNDVLLYDGFGRKAITLNATTFEPMSGNALQIHSHRGDIGISLLVNNQPKVNGITVGSVVNPLNFKNLDLENLDLENLASSMAILLRSTQDGNSIRIFDEERGKQWALPETFSGRD